ncbi:hypothetical protein BESB_056060 [Besnoitia besnoiti]|uniref:Utp14 n=1 Tax=Besnoitia besnoiti TaxID=94643 RepID=A0A2A9MD88_BESBE|nr:hypothetical protein BESB_056060 [Besnoitia besnoiti]PFH35955.1 hypothetical protein BESB_056060 [Besnoitia besnoiti]
MAGKKRAGARAAPPTSSAKVRKEGEDIEIEVEEENPWLASARTGNEAEEEEAGDGGEEEDDEGSDDDEEDGEEEEQEEDDEEEDDEGSDDDEEDGEEEEQEEDDEEEDDEEEDEEGEESVDEKKQSADVRREVPGVRKSAKSSDKEASDALSICQLMKDLTSDKWDSFKQEESEEEEEGGEEEEGEEEDDSEDHSESEDEKPEEASDKLLKSLQRLQQTEEGEEIDPFEGVSEHALSLLKTGKARAAPPAQASGDEGREADDAQLNDDSADLSFSSLLNSLSGASHSGLRKQLESLARPRSSAAESAVDRDVVQEPLGHSQQKLLSRTLAYAEAAKAARKWTPTVQRNQQAVQLQLGEGAETKAEVKSLSHAISEFKSQDDFEDALLAAVNAEGLSNESLKVAGGLGPAEPIKRQAEQRQVARLKFLLFSEQRRARRLKKIKSKVSRKKRKQAEQREEEKIMERLEVENPVLAEELRKKFEEKRAKIRMLRQQNARTKWAAVAARFGGRDIQKEISRQKQREVDERRTVERLAKSRPGASAESESEASSSSDEDEARELSAGEKAQLLRQLAREEKEIEEALPAKGLLALPFMRRGVEQRRERNRKEISSVRRAEAGEEASDDGGSDAEEGDRNARDRGEGDSDLESAVDELDDPAAAAREGERRAEEGERRRKQEDLLENKKRRLDAPAVEEAEKQLESQWDFFELQDEPARKSAAEDAKVEPNAEQKPFGSSAGAQAFFAAELKKEESRREAEETLKRRKAHERAWRDREEAQRAEVADAKKRELEQEMEAANPWLQPYKKKRKTDKEAAAARKQESTHQQLEALLDADGIGRAQSSDDESVESGAEDAREIQRRLIRQAFVCDDDAEEEFFQDQQREEEEENGGGAAAVSDALPGWGVWHGEGVRARKARGRPGAAAKSVAPAEEKNKKKRPLVVINQTLDRKAAKYFVPELPRPYTAKDQYDSTLQHPTGPEWNTSAVFNRLIAPKINVRVGAVLPPLQMARKHLGPAERDALLEAWDSKASRKQRTKARL